MSAGLGSGGKSTRLVSATYGLFLLCVFGLLRAHAQTPYVTTHLNPWVIGTNATLHGMVTPRGLPTVAWFEWGSTTNYANQSALIDTGSGQNVVFVTNQITGLIPPITYHYRLVATNNAGISFGADQIVSIGNKVWIAAPCYTSVGSNYVGLPQMGLSNVTAIAMSAASFALGGNLAYGALALKNDGTVTSWHSTGLLSETRYSTNVTWSTTNVPVPPDLSSVVAVTAGLSGTAFAALKQDGTVSVWGPSGDYFTNYPAGLSNIVAINLGDSALALRSDGVVLSWGSRGTIMFAPIVPANLSNVVDIASGKRFALALKHDGTLAAFGSSAPIIPACATNIVAIATGFYDGLLKPISGNPDPRDYPNLALRSDGQAAFFPRPQELIFPLPSTIHTNNLVGTNLALISGSGFGLDRSGNLADLRPWLSAIALTNTQTDTQTVPGHITAICGVAGYAMLLGDNGGPYAIARTVSTYANCDLIISLDGTDPNGDALAARIASLPTSGTLHQLKNGARGEIILETNTCVSDVSNRVVYVPALNQRGYGLDSFQFALRDGEFESQPAKVTIDVLASLPTLWSTYAYPVTPSNATLRGNAKANGAPAVAWFRWGNQTNRDLWVETEHYNLNTSPDFVSIQVKLDNLSPLTHYYFELCASNLVGITSSGSASFITPLSLQTFGMTPDRNFHARFFGGSNQSLTVWASTNLTNWYQVGTPANLGNGQFEFEDRSSTNALARFYQLRSP